MKELSIEEKAQAYDEVREKIAIRFGSNVADEIFSQFEMSEDEKMCKVISDIILIDSDEIREILDANNLFMQDIDAWLEKQRDKDKLIQELGEYKVKYIQETLEKALTMNNKDNERLRKTTIDFLKEFADKGYENAVECIDWLEKQGGQKPIDKIQLGKKYKCIASPRYSTFIIGKIYKPEDKFLCSLMNFCSDCFEPIEDGEHKPAK